jgi:hypothetical protein
VTTLSHPPKSSRNALHINVLVIISFPPRIKILSDIQDHL